MSAGEGSGRSLTFKRLDADGAAVLSGRTPPVMFSATLESCFLADTPPWVSPLVSTVTEEGAFCQSSYMYYYVVSSRNSCAYIVSGHDRGAFRQKNTHKSAYLFLSQNFTISGVYE